MREKQRNKTNLKLGVLTVLIVLLSALLVPGKVLHAEDEDEEKGYLTFTCEKSFWITPDGLYDDLEYATGDAPTEETVWTTATQKSAITATAATDGQYYIYFRGTNNTVITGYGSMAPFKYPWKMGSSDGAGIACRGNIETLLDYTTVKNNAHPTMDSDAYCWMFDECTSLVTAPELPAETLTECCYYCMFYECAGLTAAPELPAKTLAEDCYNCMFVGCTSLTTAPKLPAEAMEDDCYYGMFQGCTSLTTAPELPAKTLAEECYSFMFCRCTSLTTAPELPAKTLAEGCYKGMFDECKSLTAAPELPAKTLAVDCYYDMFSGCTSITTAPKLPAETLASGCYYEMFYKCTSLTTAPELPAKTMTVGCYAFMFSKCTSLTTAPGLPAKTLAEGCYLCMFDECTGLSVAPALPATTLAKMCYREMFDGCTNLKISETKTDECSAEYVIAGDKTYDYWNNDMFRNTGGTFTGNPELGRTYYVPAYYEIKADKNELSLGERDEDYTAFSASVLITDSSNVSTTLKTSLSGDSFVVGVVDENADTVALSIAPKTGLPIGDYSDTLTVWIDGQPQTTLTIPVTYTVKAHVYDDDDDDTCNSCGFVRDVHYPVADGYVYYAAYEGFDFYRNANGDTRCYDAATGAEVYNAFKCDGTYTYYFQYDRTAMRDRLTYHPDGEHIIYFDKDGHEVFSDYGHITTSIAGDKVDDYCFFDVHGYMYVDVMTYDITGTKIYYANPYGVLEHTGWFMFSDGGYGYANGDMSLMTSQHTYDWSGNLVYMEADGHIRGTGDGRNLWPASSL